MRYSKTPLDWDLIWFYHCLSAKCDVQLVMSQIWWQDADIWSWRFVDEVSCLTLMFLFAAKIVNKSYLIKCAALNAVCQKHFSSWSKKDPFHNVVSFSCSKIVSVCRICPEYLKYRSDQLKLLKFQLRKCRLCYVNLALAGFLQIDLC